MQATFLSLLQTAKCILGTGVRSLRGLALDAVALKSSHSLKRQIGSALLH